MPTQLQMSGGELSDDDFKRDIGRAHTRHTGGRIHVVDDDNNKYGDYDDTADGGEKALAHAREINEALKNG